MYVGRYVVSFWVNDKLFMCVIVQVVQRGRCKVQGCDCAQYMSLSNSRIQRGGTNCQYCEHSPSRHTRIKQQSQVQTSSGNQLQSSNITQLHPKKVQPLSQPHEAKGCMSSLPIQTKSQGN